MSFHATRVAQNATFGRLSVRRYRAPATLNEENSLIAMAYDSAKGSFTPDIVSSRVYFLYFLPGCGTLDCSRPAAASLDSLASG